MDQRPALGKGLSALIPEAPPAPPAGTTEVDIDRLTPNEHQPRGQMDEARLEELAASIRAHGVIQPILVRQTPDGYRIIAGERRWRAARRAGLRTVPVTVREIGGERASQQQLAIALIENLQREDLNPIEEARAYRRLVDEFRLTQEAVAAEVGKDRATVANTLRLLKLPPEIQNDVSDGAISMGHARALLALPGADSQLHLAREIKTRGLSVREAESLVKLALSGGSAKPPAPRAGSTGAPSDVHTRAAEDKLKVHLGTRVRILRRREGSGRIEIEFTTEDELIRLFDLLIG